MSRNVFGWDLPPGCSHRDLDRAMGGDVRDPTPLEEAVWGLLDGAGIPTEVNEAVAKILDAYYSQREPEGIDPGNDGPLDGEFDLETYDSIKIGDKFNSPSPQTMAECDCPALHGGECKYPDCSKATENER